jgi:endoglucanase
VSFSIIVRSTLDSLLGASLVLLTSACLAPPLPKATAGSGGQGSSASAQHGPREFTHTSAELLAELRLGCNLGNSLDVPDGEVAWGNPRVTPELLNAMATAGFGLVRIPITWTPHTGPAPDYVIEPLWFQRVDQVLGYARSAGLYAIINLHHDGADGYKGVGWLRLKDAEGNTTEQNNAEVQARFVAVWTQIAKHFSGAGEELLFESMNEVHDGYGTPDPRHFSFINELNQEFVSLVRQSGGNNAKRHLIIPGYNTNIEHTISGFKVPTDPTANRLILSVHYYDPYLFALQAKVHTWGKGSPGADNWGQEDDVLKQFDKLKSTFSDHGLPVLIGEYGATYQPGFEDYRRYYMEYVTKAAVDRGMLPVYWDNGGHKGGGESFGLIDRHSNTVFEPKLLEAMLRAAKSSYSLTDIAPPKPN